ncbi:MAG: lmo0937 family membrane protein [Candidatus Paceibacterota bacterium]|nr:MAG: lmo0937 family membrane protein [Candidatus Paceibacterota bacterium]
MLWTIIIALFVLWLLGFSFKVGGNFIHALLVVALVVLIVHLIS